eukprot:74068-Chlamydomonas_euryale.AAC.3
MAACMHVACEICMPQLLDLSVSRPLCSRCSSPARQRMAEELPRACEHAHAAVAQSGAEPVKRALKQTFRQAGRQAGTHAAAAAAVRPRPHPRVILRRVVERALAHEPHHRRYTPPTPPTPRGAGPRVRRRCHAPPCFAAEPSRGRLPGRFRVEFLAGPSSASSREAQPQPLPPGGCHGKTGAAARQRCARAFVRSRPFRRPAAAAAARASRCRSDAPLPLSGRAAVAGVGALEGCDRSCHSSLELRLKQLCPGRARGTGRPRSTQGGQARARELGKLIKCRVSQCSRQRLATITIQKSTSSTRVLTYEGWRRIPLPCVACDRSCRGGGRIHPTKQDVQQSSDVSHTYTRLLPH